MAIFWQRLGPCFNIRQGILLLDLVKPRCRKIGSLIYCITLKSDRHIDSNAADVPIKFQSNRTILNTNLVASRLHEILQYDFLSDIEMGPSNAEKYLMRFQKTLHKMAHENLVKYWGTVVLSFTMAWFASKEYCKPLI